MSLAEERIVSTLIESMQQQNNKTEAYDTPATVRRIEGDTAWVHIPGGVDETPVKLTISASVGDTVQVRVSGGRAFLVGNASAPPTDDTAAKEAEQKVTLVTKVVETVKKVAESAARIAGNTNQYFWHTETGTDTGAHITEIPREEFLADPDNGGGNLLARSNGIAVRDGLDELAIFSAGGARIGMSGNAHVSLDYRSMEFVDQGGLTFFKVVDLRDADGVADIVEHHGLYFHSDAMSAENLFEIGLTPLAIISYTILDSSSADVTSQFIVQEFGSRGISVNGPSSALGNRYSMAIEYTTISNLAKAYTAGIRNPSYDVGAMSFAEGNNTAASGPYSHTEGFWSESVGYATHAEGYATEASDNFTHAEGYATKASGQASHAQNDNTETAYYAQTAIGQYNDNQPDTAFEIGNGAPGARSNALTVDWNGNLETAGDITDGSGNTLSAIASLLSGAIMVRSLQIISSSTTIAAGGNTGDTTVTPAAISGYTPILATPRNTGGNGMVNFYKLYMDANNEVVFSLANPRTSAVTFSAAYVNVLYVKSELIGSPSQTLSVSQDPSTGVLSIS